MGARSEMLWLIEKHTAWDIPPTLSWGAVISVLGTSSLFLGWKIYDRYIKPRQYSWFAKMRRPYEDMEAIALAVCHSPSDRSE